MKEIIKTTNGVSLLTDGEFFSVYGEHDDHHGFAAGFIVEYVSEEEAREAMETEENRRYDQVTAIANSK